jgi:hypothetical protein
VGQQPALETGFDEEVESPFQTDDLLGVTVAEGLATLEKVLRTIL